MDYGLHISASGALTAMYRMDVLGANMANMGTPGFKPDSPTLRQRETALVEDGLSLPSNALLERLGGGVQIGPNRISFTQGALTDTENPLDVAIQGEGFFVVRESGGREGDRLRLTRDGRFTLDPRGRLVMASSGLPVMSTGGDDITLDPRKPIAIAGDGQVSQDGAPVARIRLADVPDRSSLEKIGASMFRATAEALQSRMEGTGVIRQGMIEQSAVDPVRTMLEISSAGRAVESNITLMQYTDRMMDRAINTLGRTA